MYMGMYRPPFPIYPPLGSFPLFPGGNPFAGLSPLSPSAAGKLPNTCGNKTLLSPFSLPKIGLADKENQLDEPLRRRNSIGSESNDSHGSSGSDAENNSSGSEAESECSASKKPRLHYDMDESRDIRHVPFQPHRPIPYMPVVPKRKIPEPEIRSSPIHREQEPSMPFDFSKTRSPSPPRSASPRLEPKPVGEQPLDLTRKAPSEVITPENSRKTHIFGMPCSLAESKLHYAYPQLSKPLVLEHLRMEKAKYQQTIQDAAKFLPFPRFPLSTPSYAAAALGMMKPEVPLMKMEKLPEHFPYGSPHKMKERYSCKFCGKVNKYLLKIKKKYIH